MANQDVNTEGEGFNRSNRRHWTDDEDKMLVQCLVELYHLGSYNADCGFRQGYLPILEKMLQAKLPNSAIKAKPHIDNRLRTLKKEWAIVHDMVYGMHTSGFGWDATRRVVTAEEAVWDEYLKSHKNAAPFKNRALPYFEDLSMIYAKDRATGKDAQTAADIVEELEGENDEDGGTENNENGIGVEEVGLNGAENVRMSMDEDNIRSMSPSTSRGRITRSDGAKRTRLSMNATQKNEAYGIAEMLGSKMVEATKELTKNLETEQLIAEKSMQLWDELNKIEGLSQAEKRAATRKIPSNPINMLVFFTIPTDEKEIWVKELLDDGN